MAFRTSLLILNTRTMRRHGRPLKRVIDLDSVTVRLAMLAELTMQAHLQSGKGWNLGSR